MEATKKKKVIKIILKICIPIVAIAVILAIALQIAGFGPLYGLYEPKSNSSKYTDELESYGIWDNTIENQIPQTVVHKLVMDHFNSPLPEGKTVKKVIFLGFDGFRADAIANVKDDPQSAIMYVKSLGGLYHAYAGGVPGQSEQHTSTAPGWASMLTGGWSMFHGINNNGQYKNGNETFLTTLAKQGHNASFTASWREHTALSYRPDIVQSIKNNIPVEYNHEIDDMATYYQVLKYVAKSEGQKKTAKEDPDVIFFTFEFTDHNGHLYGFGNNRNYYQGSIDANYYGYDIIKTIEARDTYDQEDWLILISTDHGGTGHVHGNQTIMERSTWIAVNKKIDITDEYLNYGQAG